VETFVEGRSFWRNIRRALGLLLGGNLGELGLIMGASLLGAGIPLNTRQILAVNAITDILPALAIALQQPEHRNLAELSREGTSALGVPLRNEILRRSIATTLPSLASYLITLRAGGQLEARTIAFTSIITTQLAQTLDAGRSEGHLTKSVFGAVAGSLGVLAITFLIPPLRAFFNLAIPSPMGWALIAGGALVAVVLSRLLALPPLRELDLNLRLPALPPRLATVPKIAR
jgi:magnesium-transporting ATPase (P-type)